MVPAFLLCLCPRPIFVLLAGPLAEASLKEENYSYTFLLCITVRKKSMLACERALNKHLSMSEQGKVKGSVVFR